MINFNSQETQYWMIKLKRIKVWCLDYNKDEKNKRNIITIHDDFTYAIVHFT
jgi:hypothetical protein